MMTLETVKRRLEPMNLRRVAQETGIHENALYRLMRDKTRPSYETVKRLSDWLEALEGEA